MRARVKLILAALMLIMGSALVGFTALPAEAATCTWSGCNGKDPETYGCTAGATTRSQAYDEFGNKLELRYSSRCHAVWTRGSGVASGQVLIQAGYVDYYGTWHREKQYAYIGSEIDCGCLGWTGMISIHRYERYRFGRKDRGSLWTWINSIDGCPDSTCP